MSTRDELLRQAAALFAERGYDAVGVQELCASTGVTKPTLYHHFGSKRGLLDTLVGERYAPLVAELAAAAVYHGDLPGTLARVVTAYFDFTTRDPTVARLVLSLWHAPPKSEAVQAVALLRTEQQRVLEGLFARAANDHGHMRGRQRAYAMTLIGMIHTYVGLAVNGEVELGDYLARVAVQQYSHGIYS